MCSGPSFCRRRDFIRGSGFTGLVSRLSLGLGFMGLGVWCLGLV